MRVGLPLVALVVSQGKDYGWRAYSVSSCPLPSHTVARIPLQTPELGSWRVQTSELRGKETSILYKVLSLWDCVVTTETAQDSCMGNLGSERKMP